MFATIEPITFSKAISLLPFKTACKLTNNSGAELAKETNIILTTKLEISKLKARETEPLTNNPNPKKRNINSSKKQ